MRGRHLLRELRNAGKAFSRNIKLFLSRPKELYRFLTKEKNAAALRHLKEETGALFKEAAPKKGGGYLKLGLSDPYSTGRAMELAALCYPYLKDKIEVIPVFDAPFLESRIRAKGRIRLFVLLKIAFRLYRDKNLFRMYEELKRLMAMPPEELLKKEMQRQKREEKAAERKEAEKPEESRGQEQKEGNEALDAGEGHAAEKPKI